ncbi:insulinase family protein [Escherichia coli]|nr:insulinase family protein [Escherichia coli]
MITIPITFCMLIAKYLCLLKPFWLRKNNKTSVLLIIIILAMILGVVKIQVWLNDWNNDFFNALSQKETDKLWQLVLWFPALLGIFVLISVNKTWLIKLLTIRWREWLTDYYLNRWFADKNYYFTQIYGEHKNTDNPDQRIAEDILLLISKTLSLSFGFIQSLSMLITFTVILWQSAGTLSFTVGGTEWSIQGYMVYTVVLIVIGGTLFTHKVGKRIRPLNVEKQRSEATFRTNLVQHNKQAELIALSNAESLQRQELSENFHTIKENWHRLMNRQRWLDYWQNIYSRSLSVLPYFLLLPQFISGQINLGGLMKSRQAFMLVSNNLSWFIYKYDELAELAAVIDRLYEFHQLTEQRPTNKPKNCQHAVQVADASIRTPDNKIILENLNFHVSPGKWLLLKGYSGAGKTTLLKTLSHCWPWFKGDISSPADSWYVSQTPLIKTGLLKEIICKALPLSVDDKSLSEVLHQVGLGKLAARIHGFQLINQRITHSTINDNIWASLQNAQIQALKTLDQRPAEKFAQQMYETRYADDRTKLLQENQIAQFTAADALAADRQLFSSPADITFVIVGNVAEDKLVALITRYLGSIKHSDSSLAAGKPLTRATDNASVTVKEQNEPVAQVSQWKRYNSRTPVNLATRMALDAFNVALAKDLRINIREQASGAYSVSSRLSVDPQAKDISHLLAFTCQPERHDELLTLANEVMVKRLAKGISEQELNEYQQNVQRSLDIQQRSVQQLANTIVNSLIQYDDPAAWTEQEQLLKQMTVENVNTAVKQYLSHPVNTYTGVLLPK